MKYFGIVTTDKHSRGEEIRVGRWICKILLRIGKWCFVKRVY